jgi:hypothetical protein
MAGASKPVDVSTKQRRIAELARQSPEMGFTSLAYYIDIDWLHAAFTRTRKDGAVGVDGQDGEAYAANLKGNLQSLLDRAKSGTYQAPPVRRVHIPKGGSPTETRPLGIPICRSYCTSLQRRWGLIEGGPSQPNPGLYLSDEADFRDQERRVGLRKRLMMSDVSLIHHGAQGADWIPSSVPDWHQSAIVDTFTFSISAAVFEEHRPFARQPPAHAAGASGQPLTME